MRELQERARQNDPRAQQAVAQLQNAQGKRDEAAWAWFPKFETLVEIIRVHGPGGSRSEDNVTLVLD